MNKKKYEILIEKLSEFIVKLEDLNKVLNEINDVFKDEENFSEDKKVTAKNESTKKSKMFLSRNKKTDK